MCMDLLDQFKKIACIGLNYGKQIEEKRKLAKWAACAWQLKEANILHGFKWQARYGMGGFGFGFNSFHARI